jgi:hypothetical protein
MGHSSQSTLVHLKLPTEFLALFGRAEEQPTHYKAEYRADCRSDDSFAVIDPELPQ